MNLIEKIYPVGVCAALREREPVPVNCHTHIGVCCGCVSFDACDVSVARWVRCQSVCEKRADFISSWRLSGLQAARVEMPPALLCARKQMLAQYRFHISKLKPRWSGFERDVCFKRICLYLRRVISARITGLQKKDRAG